MVPYGSVGLGLFSNLEKETVVISIVLLLLVTGDFRWIFRDMSLMIQSFPIVVVCLCPIWSYSSPEEIVNDKFRLGGFAS